MLISISVRQRLTCSPKTVAQFGPDGFHAQIYCAAQTAEANVAPGSLQEPDQNPEAALSEIIGEAKNVRASITKALDRSRTMLKAIDLLTTGRDGRCLTPETLKHAKRLAADALQTRT